MEREQREKEIEDKKKAEQQAIFEKQQKEQMEKQIRENLRKQGIDKLVELTGQKVTESKYDKYFMMEFAKKLKTEEVMELVQLLEATDEANCPAIIEGKVNELESQRQAKIQQARDEAKKKEEEKKQTKKKTWTKEDVHILTQPTQAMNKFPTGLANRWV